MIGPSCQYGEDDEVHLLSDDSGIWHFSLAKDDKSSLNRHYASSTRERSANFKNETSTADSANDESERDDNDDSIPPRGCADFVLRMRPTKNSFGRRKSNPSLCGKGVDADADHIGYLPPASACFASSVPRLSNGLSGSYHDPVVTFDPSLVLSVAEFNRDASSLSDSQSSSSSSRHGSYVAAKHWNRISLPAWKRKVKVKHLLLFNSEDTQHLLTSKDHEGHLSYEGIEYGNVVAVPESVPSGIDDNGKHREASSYSSVYANTIEFDALGNSGGIEVFLETAPSETCESEGLSVSTKSSVDSPGEEMGRHPENKENSIELVRVEQEEASTDLSGCEFSTDVNGYLEFHVPQSQSPCSVIGIQTAFPDRTCGLEPAFHSPFPSWEEEMKQKVCVACRPAEEYPFDEYVEQCAGVRSVGTNTTAAATDDSAESLRNETDPVLNSEVKNSETMPLKDTEQGNSISSTSKGHWHFRSVPSLTEIRALRLNQ